MAARRARQRRIVARDGVVGQTLQFVDLAAGGEILEGADAQVAGCHTRQHRARQGRVAVDLLAGGDHGQRPRAGDSQAVHGFADQHLAQHRTNGRPAVAAARKRRASGAFEGDVAPLPVAVDQLAQQQRAAVSQLRREATELVSGIGLCDRLGALRQHIAGQPGGALGTLQRIRRQAQFIGQRRVQEQHLRGGRRGRLAGHIQARQYARIGVVEGEVRHVRGVASLVWAADSGRRCPTVGVAMQPTRQMLSARAVTDLDKGNARRRHGS